MIRIWRSLIFAAILLAGAPAAVAETPRYQDIGPAELSELLKRGVTVVDVRLPEEWQETGVVPGSTLITAFDRRGRFVPDFAAEFQARVGRDQPVILICRTGARSQAIAGLLTQQGGYTAVHNVPGGILAWIGDGRPTVTCPIC